MTLVGRVFETRPFLFEALNWGCGKAVLSLCKSGCFLRPSPLPPTIDGSNILSKQHLLSPPQQRTNPNNEQGPTERFQPVALAGLVNDNGISTGGDMAKQLQKSEKSQRELRNTGALIAELDENLNGNPTHEQVELRAYELYVQGGCVDGNDMQNWLQAESELREMAPKPVSVTKAAAA